MAGEEMGHAALKIEETPHKPLGYRATRTTIVLAAASALYRSMQNDELKKAVEEVKGNNYDFNRTPDSVLEHIYAVFDDEMMDKVKAEFEFVPRADSMRWYGGREGTCALCGKGDSRDDRDNHDKLIHGFKLTNLHGGEDLWVGSSCIINHALKVRGAATSEEAKNILEKSMREHLALWKIEMWRAAHLDHVHIPEHYKALQAFSRRLTYLRYAEERDALTLLGPSPNGSNAWGHLRDVRWKTERTMKQFRTTARFYERRGHVTEKKMKAWNDARVMLTSLSWLFKTIDRAAQLSPGEEHEAFLLQEKAKRDAWLAQRKKRTPNEELPPLTKKVRVPNED